MYFSPLPNFKDFLSPFKKRVYNNSKLLKPWVKDGEIAGWLSRSAWSLVLIALWKRKLLNNENKINIWIPDFFCNSSLDILRKTEENIVFYNVKDDMEPDYNSCREKALISPPDIFLFVHYFGKPFDSASAKQFCSRYNSWLIEDAVHATIPNSSIGKFGDFIIYSPHKIFPVPNGSILVIRKKGPGLINIDSNYFISDQKMWLKTLEQFIIKKNIKLKSNILFLLIWFFKRFAQKTGLNRQSILSYKENLDHKENKTYSFINPQVSSLSLKIIRNHINDITKINLQRIKNNKIWNYYISKSFSNKLDKEFLLNLDNEIDYSPYMSIFKFEKKSIKNIFNQLQQKNIKITTWPDLPPEIKKNKFAYKNAWNLRHSYFYIPCHQSISPNSFYEIMKDYKLNNKNHNNIFFEKNKVSRIEWHNLLSKVNKSNLLQSWAYVSAKSSTEGWRVSRLVFKNKISALAIVSVLEKKILGLKIIRVNRGPLFMPNTKSDEKEIILKKILDFGKISKMTLLSISPEINLNGKNISFLISNNVKLFKIKTWTSICVNISSDLDVLKSNLTSKWRNKLNISFKNNLKIESGYSSELMSWLLDKYSMSMKEKSFKGISISLFKNIYNQKQYDNRLLFFRVSKDGEPLSGLCIACHGCSATYLIGWTGEKGRNLKANHFQLWHVLKKLKKINIKSIDLGGIDKDETPGITEFKLGIGGQKYSIAGEGWKYN